MRGNKVFLLVLLWSILYTSSVSASQLPKYELKWETDFGPVVELAGSLEVKVTSITTGTVKYGWTVSGGNIRDLGDGRALWEKPDAEGKYTISVELVEGAVSNKLEREVDFRNMEGLLLGLEEPETTKSKSMWSIISSAVILGFSVVLLVLYRKRKKKGQN